MLIFVFLDHFNNCILFYYVNISQFIYSSIHPIDTCLGSFQFLTITNRVVMTILIHVSSCTYYTFSMIYIYVELLGHRYSTFHQIMQNHPQRLYPFLLLLHYKGVLIFPFSSNWCSQIFTFLRVLWIWNSTSYLFYK